MRCAPPSEDCYRSHEHVARTVCEALARRSEKPLHAVSVMTARVTIETAAYGARSQLHMSECCKISLIAGTASTLQRQHDPHPADAKQARSTNQPVAVAQRDVPAARADGLANRSAACNDGLSGDALDDRAGHLFVSDPTERGRATRACATGSSHERRNASHDPIALYCWKFCIKICVETVILRRLVSTSRTARSILLMLPAMAMR